MKSLLDKLDWDKMNGLIPAVIQAESSHVILMLGYMDPAALLQTLTTKIITFYSRSRKALWVKGETSGNQLQLCDIYPDCDNDALLITVKPIGPTCHQGTASCFGESISKNNIISFLEALIEQRQKLRPNESYVASLFNSGLNRIAQKVGEEGVEVALAAALADKKGVTQEVADLLFHMLVLLRAREVSFTEVLDVLSTRHQITAEAVKN